MPSKPWKYALLLFASGLALAENAFGQQTARPDWEIQALKVFPEETVARLREEKVVLVEEPLRQVFQALITTDPDRKNSFPYFITSDAVLHAAVVLSDESFVRMEAARASLLLRTFQRALEGLPKTYDRIADPSPTTERARKLAQLVLAMPCELMGRRVEGLDAEAAAWVKGEKRRVKEARESVRPDWLDESEVPAESVYDYRLCRPVGAYVQPGALSGYFRAVRWLQLARLPTDSDANWIALSLIAEAVFASRKNTAPADGEIELAAMLSQIGTLFGDMDGGSIFSRQALPFLASEKVSTKEILRGRLPTHEALLLPPRVLPDTLLFGETAGGAGFENRAMPRGLEMAAWLGSPLADAELRRAQMGKVADKVRELSHESLHGSDHYTGWLRVLSGLVEETDPDAPEFFRGRAWQRKTMETLLASWAQMRRASVLQSKADFTVTARFEAPPGFIEPNPMFFHQLADWCAAIASDLERHGVFSANAFSQSTDIHGISSRLTEHASALRSRDNTGTDDVSENPTQPDPLRTIAAEHDVGSARDFLHRAARWNPDWEALPVPGKLTTVAESLDHLARELSAGTREPLHDPFPAQLRQSWNDLIHICHTLATLCHKQIRGLEFTIHESNFIEGLGERLASIEFYGGHSSWWPRDDAPKPATVFRSPNGEQHLIAATGRPLALYVLYPWKGRQVLCRGASMTYYEWAAEAPLTDQEWLRKLDSASAPRRPAWALPVQASLPSKP